VAGSAQLLICFSDPEFHLVLLEEVFKLAIPAMTREFLEYFFSPLSI